MAMARPITCALALALAVLAGCGSEPTGVTPAACLQRPSAYLGALVGAFDRVALAPGVGIADCLVKDQPAGELATVGSSLIAVATDLNAQAARKPGGAATVQLGYLLGAAELAAEDTGGIDDDLIRRLNAAAYFSEGGGAQPAAFEHAFATGYAAGRDQG